ncbi:sugar transferase [Streptomyces sp. NBC_00838]|uniref:sugar transferase n=1 Tax=Streptomyces sp. NBC_00838 TaxID=2903680 RepID=UPI0038641B6E|nr:sugar transferase [Streptomyces sp. NBC_00838]
MNTESTSVPAPSGRGSTARGPADPGAPGAPGPTTVTTENRPPLGYASLLARQDGADRLALPPRRRTAAPLRFGLPLLASDWLSAVIGTALLDSGQRHALLIAQLLICVAVLNAYAGLYRPSGPRTALDEFPALAARTFVAWCASAALLAALHPTHALSLAALLAGSATQLLLACCGRAVVHGYRRRTARKRLSSALVVGTGPTGRRFAALFARHPEYGLRPVGIVAPVEAEGPAGPDGGPHDDGVGEDHPADADTPAPGLPVLSTVEEIHRAVIQNGVRQAVFVDGPDGAGGDEERAGLVSLFHEYGCATWFVGAGPWDTVVRSGTRRGMSQHVWGYTCHRVNPPAPPRGALAKRLLDIAVAAIALVTVSPVLLACALAVRFLDGPGVLFRQERVGQNGRPFTVLKFRTLRPADDTEAATRWSVANDRRMSTVGHILRRTSMDELPQIWNVLRGDMSLVGPRPERPFFVANFSKTHPGYAARHRMPVGITGLAQVNGLRGDTSIEDRSRFDNHYIDHWSLWQDVCIIIRTALSLVRPAGS